METLNLSFTYNPDLLPRDCDPSTSEGKAMIVQHLLGDLQKRNPIAAAFLDDGGTYVDFREVSRAVGMQNQYACLYIFGTERTPALGEGVRIQNWPNKFGDYHSIKVHEDDVNTLIERIKDHRRTLGYTYND